MSLVWVRLGAIVVALVALAGTYLFWSAGAELQSAVDAKQSALQRLDTDLARLRGAEPKPLLPRADTIEQFLGKMLDDTELFGSSVRINQESGPLQWSSEEHGIEKAFVSVTTAAETESAMGYFTILWELLSERPVAIRNASITVSDEVTSMTIGVDLYALGVEP